MIHLLARQGLGPGCPGSWPYPLRHARRPSRACTIAGLALGLVSLVAQKPASADTRADLSPFFKAVESGDSQSAIAIGQRLYTSLAFDGQGRGAYLQAGFLLSSWAEAAADIQRDVRKIYQQPEPKLAPGLTAMWRQYDHSMNQAAGLVFPADEAGRFLRTYLGLSVDAYAREILDTVQRGTGQMDPKRESLAASYVVVFLCLGEPEAVCDMPNVMQAASWIAAHDSSGAAAGMVKECLSRRRFDAACLLGKALLSGRPGDADVCRQFIDLIAELRKAHRTTQAIGCCEWACRTVRDPVLRTTLLLQQAVIIGTDEKNYSLAVRMCDDVASGRDAASDQVALARWLAGACLLSQGNLDEAIRREQSLIDDAASPSKYRTLAATVLLNAWSRSGKPDTGIQIVSSFLKTLPQPEPQEVADCRRALCTTMLSAQRYDEAAEQCRLLIARHPGTPAARAANLVLEQLARGTGSDNK
jgi:hypothetical protein